jgi:hypothetical protein
LLSTDYGTFDIKTKTIEFRTDCSSRRIVVPHLTVFVLFNGRYYACTGLAATSFDIQHQAIQLADNYIMRHWGGCRWIIERHCGESDLWIETEKVTAKFSKTVATAARKLASCNIKPAAQNLKLEWLHQQQN